MTNPESSSQRVTVASGGATRPTPFQALMTIGASGVSAGIAGGLVEAAVRHYGLPGVTRLADVSADFFWILPVGLALFQLPVIVAAALGHLAAPRWLTVGRAVALATVLPIWSVSLAAASTRLAAPVHVIISVGLATVVGRFVDSNAVRFRRGLAWCMPLFVGGPVVILSALIVTRHRQAQPGNPAAQPESPNVILLVWDTVRRRSLSLQGYDRETTPHLIELARQGVVFDRAFSTSPWTLPGHAAIFTGHQMQALSSSWRTPLDRAFPVVAEVFASAGYRTGGFTANLMATHRPTGLARGFHRYEDVVIGRLPRNYLPYPTAVATLRRLGPLKSLSFLQNNGKDADLITRRFLRWVDDSTSGRPFFAFLNYFDAHQPYRSPPAFRARFQGRPTDRYDAAIAYLDTELDRLFGELERRGLLANTVIALTSDHGEAFGEHGYHGHGSSLLAEALEVPLVIWAPGRIPAGLRLARVVSTRHLGPTLIDLAGVQPTVPLGGSSLRRFWADTLVVDTAVAGVHQGVNETETSQITGGNAVASIDEDHYYIRTGRGQELLFGLPDLRQERNLAADPGYAEVLARIRSGLGKFGPIWTPFDSTDRR